MGGFQGLVLARQEHHLLAIARVCPSHFLIKAGEAGSGGTRACEAQQNWQMEYLETGNNLNAGEGETFLFRP